MLPVCSMEQPGLLPRNAVTVRCAQVVVASKALSQEPMDDEVMVLKQYCIKYELEFAKRMAISKCDFIAAKMVNDELQRVTHFASL